MCSMNIVASDEIFYLHLTSKAANNGCHQMCSHTWYKKKITKLILFIFLFKNIFMLKNMKKSFRVN